MKEVDASECAGNNGPNFTAGAVDSDLCVSADVRENIALAKFDEG